MEQNVRTILRIVRKFSRFFSQSECTTVCTILLLLKEKSMLKRLRVKSEEGWKLNEIETSR